MAEDVLFDDSPIAKYIASVQTSSKKGQKIRGFKIEKASQLEETASTFGKEAEAQKTPPAPHLPSQSNPSARLSLLGIPENLVTQVQRESIVNAACKLIETAFPSDSPFSGLRDSFSPFNATSADALEESLSRRIMLVSVLALAPLIIALFSSFLCVSIYVVAWPFITFVYVKMSSKIQFIRDTAKLASEFSRLGPESTILFLKVRSALQLIQEVELVSRGYRITTHLSPISRLEQGAKIRRCQLLRRETFKSLSSVQHLVASYLPDSENHSSLFGYSPSGENDDSIAHLKHLYQIIQIGLIQYAEHIIVRRMHFSKEQKNEWRIINLPTGAEMAQLRKEICDLNSAICEASGALTSALTYQESWVSPQTTNNGTPARNKGTKNGTIRNSLLEHLSALQSSLQTQAARIVLLKDQMQQLDEHPEATLNEMIQTFSKLSDELSLQLPAYSASVTHSLNKLTRQLQGSDEENSAERDASAISVAKDGSIESIDFCPTGASDGTLNSESIESLMKLIPTSSSALEKVYEADTGAEEEYEIKPSALTREERIALAKIAREEARLKEEEVFAKLNFVLELKDVLNSRREAATQNATFSETGQV